MEIKGIREIIQYFEDKRNHLDADVQHISKKEMQAAAGKVSQEARSFLEAIIYSKEGYDRLRNVQKEGFFNDSEVSMLDLYAAERGTGCNNENIDSELIQLQQVITREEAIRAVIALGKGYTVPFSDGRITTAVILTYEGINGLGIDLNTVFKGCGGGEKFNERTDIRNGVLVNLGLYQQVALLRAIIAKKPELKDVLGLYNLRGSRKVYEELSRAGIPRQLDVWWMWTGDKYLPKQNNEGAYPEEGIVTLSKIPTLKDNRFVNRSFAGDCWVDYYPDDHNGSGAAVFGAQR